MNCQDYKVFLNQNYQQIIFYEFQICWTRMIHVISKIV